MLARPVTDAEREELTKLRVWKQTREALMADYQNHASKQMERAIHAEEQLRRLRAEFDLYILRNELPFDAEEHDIFMREFRRTYPAAGEIRQRGEVEQLTEMEKESVKAKLDAYEDYVHELRYGVQ